MGTALAAAVRERARLAWQEVQAARRGDDAHARLVAEAEWEDVQRLARAHAVAVELPSIEGSAQAGAAQGSQAERAGEAAG
ncbi:hypothetical protein [Nonomuraea rhodomycinica]|uniref:Uncharacterized protein n=1 Tax=Nonomuraea rhodomycinica TaxID=1712872 RepID=A0A7Y6MBZ9_9ACTN|nr:hypothetical protein [Nonomuraea rhodomycinica]NUW41251.1 hypothetical protein [Nonomuraea rhodomycinica]